MNIDDQPPPSTIATAMTHARFGDSAYEASDTDTVTANQPTMKRRTLTLP
jgi:hypothetical protein